MADPNPFGLADGQFALELYTDKSIMVRANRATITQYAGQLIAMKGMYKDDWRGYPGCMFPRVREAEIRQKIHMPAGYVQAKATPGFSATQNYAQNYAQMLAAAQSAPAVVQAPTAVPLPGNMTASIPLPPLATPIQPQGPRMLKNQELKVELETHADNYQETMQEVSEEKTKELESRISALEAKCLQYQTQLEQLTSFCSQMSQIVQTLMNSQASPTPQVKEDLPTQPPST